MKPKSPAKLSHSPPQDAIALEAHPEGVVVPVHARPGARSEGFSGVHDGALKISVKQVPEKGKANNVLATVLAQALGLPMSRVELLAGATSRRKRFLVKGVTSSQLAARLTTLFDQLK